MQTNHGDSALLHHTAPISAKKPDFSITTQSYTVAIKKPTSYGTVTLQSYGVGGSAPITQLAGADTKNYRLTIA
jgi:hypothetical protein